MTRPSSSLSALTKYLISGSILFASIAVSVVLYSLKKDPENKKAVDLMPLVATQAARSFDGGLGIEVGGLVVPYREINISAEVSGRIETKTDACRAGNFVKAGTLLMTIDKKDFDLAIKRLNAEVKQAKAMISELENEIEGLGKTIKHAEEDLALQEEEFNRRKDLSSALSKSEIQQARRNLIASARVMTELENSRALLETRKGRLQSGIDLSQAQLDAAKLDLERTDIYAPFDGVVVNDMVESGDFVQKGENIVVLEDTSKAEVQCNLRLDQIDRILKYKPLDPLEARERTRDAYRLPPTTVEISTEIGDETVSWTGTLMRYDGIGVDERTKTVPCSIIVDDPIAKCGTRDHALVRGYFVDVLIVLETNNRSDESALVEVPAVAVQPGNYVWSVRDKKLMRHKVKIVDRQAAKQESEEDTVVIDATSGGIDPGDQIVVSPLTQPIPGIEVKVNEAEGDDPTSTATRETADRDEPQVTSTKGDSSS